MRCASADMTLSTEERSDWVICFGLSSRRPPCTSRSSCSPPAMASRCSANDAPSCSNSVFLLRNWSWTACNASASCPSSPSMAARLAAIWASSFSSFCRLRSIPNCSD
eukprot:3387044-Amphidinium_carterae.1